MGAERGGPASRVVGRLRPHWDTWRRVGWRTALRRLNDRLWHAAYPLRVVSFATALLAAAASRAACFVSGGRLARSAADRWRDLFRFHFPRRDLSGMIRPEEQCFLEYHGRHELRGRGAVVDLGCFLGATTISVARGVARNRRVGRAPPPVHAYDLFVWQTWMNPAVAGSELAGRYRPGESFLPEFERRLGRWRDLVQLHPEDLTTARWEFGPIELLVVDAMKSWELMNAIHRAFLPALLPKDGLLVHQDFAHVHTPWIHLGVFRLRDCLESVCHVPRSGSHVFRLTRAVPDERLANPLERAQFSHEEVEAAFEHSLAITPADMRPDVAAARVLLHLQDGDPEAAREALKGFRGRGLPMVGDLAWVEDELGRH